MKYVLVSGGVISGIGKGIIASSTGLLLKTMGLKVIQCLGLSSLLLFLPCTKPGYKYQDRSVSEYDTNANLQNTPQNQLTCRPDVDAGTMAPTEHGECFVLDDGGEVDLDLGNYER